MFKGELIAWLNDPNIPEDVDIYVSSDEEGNEYNMLCDVTYYPHDEDDFEEVPMIVLWP
jgi:hypothetical protein